MGKKAEIARPRRVVLDTNVAVSALVFREGRLAWLRKAWAAGRIVPLVSAETVEELVRVLAYPKFKLSEDETKNVLAHYMEHAEAVPQAGGTVRIPECRDPDDGKFLRLAYAAGADALATGDDDLLVLAGQSRVPIFTPGTLKRELEEAPLKKG